MIPDSFIQELLGRVDIVDVVERHVPLKKAGANYSACCPFHSEKTPSFTVSPSKQFYHCFGCGMHGSAIGFVMQYSGLGFVEAVEELAEVFLHCEDSDRDRLGGQNAKALISCFYSFRHGRACPGHPRLYKLRVSKTWMPAT